MAIAIAESNAAAPMSGASGHVHGRRTASAEGIPYPTMPTARPPNNTQSLFGPQSPANGNTNVAPTIRVTSVTAPTPVALRRVSHGHTVGPTSAAITGAANSPMIVVQEERRDEQAGSRQPTAPSGGMLLHARESADRRRGSHPANPSTGPLQAANGLNARKARHRSLFADRDERSRVPRLRLEQLGFRGCAGRAIRCRLP